MHTDFCSTECNEGKFGLNCNLPCGHCLNNVDCHYIDGTCLNGCDSGYQGSNCKQGICNVKKDLLKYCTDLELLSYINLINDHFEKSVLSLKKCRFKYH